VHVGVIGTGNIAETHARAALAAGLTVDAIVGRSMERARLLCDRFGGTPYDSLETFLAHPSLELVSICTPSGQHGEQGIAAARRGLHVLVEKPIDVTPARADALIAETDRAGVRLAVCFQDRFAPDLCAVKRLVDEGRLGRLLTVDARAPWYRPASYYESSTWRGTWALDGGGALMNQGSHTADLLVWLLGDVARVSGLTSTLRHRIEVEDTAMALVEFANGVRGTLFVTTAVYPGYPRRIMLAGTAGTVTIERENLVAADFEDGPVPGLEVRPPAPDDGRSSTPAIGDISGHRALFEDFVRAIRTGDRPRCDGREGRRSLALIRAIYDSSASGHPVTLADRA
jgi:UDP-N-acetyl-2-amino-2-deoxyglucuronate dehydrogenase